KELRNPFNLVLGVMCLSTVVPLVVRVSLLYRQLFFIGRCSIEKMTYSLALHMFVEFNCWAPFRALYTWLAAILTLMRYRSLRSKGRWEASYPLVFISMTLLASFCGVAGIPLFLFQEIQYRPVDVICPVDTELFDSHMTIPLPGLSFSMVDNNCLV
ncbi:hypothetical protein PENTCL1PPCAC_12231, partial [Pristionchus entomophagus]